MLRRQLRVTEGAVGERHGFGQGQHIRGVLGAVGAVDRQSRPEEPCRPCVGADGHGAVYGAGETGLVRRQAELGVQGGAAAAGDEEAVHHGLAIEGRAAVELQGAEVGVEGRARCAADVARLIEARDVAGKTADEVVAQAGQGAAMDHIADDVGGDGTENVGVGGTGCVLGDDGVADLDGRAGRGIDTAGDVARVARDRVVDQVRRTSGRVNAPSCSQAGHGVAHLLASGSSDGRSQQAERLKTRTTRGPTTHQSDACLECENGSPVVAEPNGPARVIPIPSAG